MTPRRVWGLRSRAKADAQGLLPFAVRAARRERAFRRLILASTLAVLALTVVATPAGRDAARRLPVWGREAIGRLVGMPPDRRLVEARRRAVRLRSADAARRALAGLAPAGSRLGRFLRAAKMDAGSAVVRWGNVDRAIVLSSAVFEPDDARSYRLKPGVRSVWVIGLGFHMAVGIFLIPDTPEARAAAGEAGGLVVPGSTQTTNSWGCRGPEPDPAAPVRVLVVGDSMMQGALVGDAQTPPARLQARLAGALGAPVSVLNAGHLGYSPEQYLQTLLAFGDRFRPHYVLVSLSANDFGGRTAADWDEAGYWLDRIAGHCLQRGWPLLLVPAPEASSLVGRRDLDRYQGRIDRIVKRGGTEYVDPLEPFTDELLALRNDERRRGRAVTNPLFNLHLMGDRHFSPLGSDLWAQVVSRRLLLAWDSLAFAGYAVPGPVRRHALAGGAAR